MSIPHSVTFGAKTATSETVAKAEISLQREIGMISVRLIKDLAEDTKQKLIASIGRSPDIEHEIATKWENIRLLTVRFHRNAVELINGMDAPVVLGEGFEIDGIENGKFIDVILENKAEGDPAFELVTVADERVRVPDAEQEHEFEMFDAYQELSVNLSPSDEK